MAEPSFARIPAWVISCAQLSASDWRIYCCLALHANGTGWAWPSMATIADETSTRRKDVPRAIRRLEELGVIHVDRGGGRSANRYQIAQERPKVGVSANLRTVSVRNSADAASSKLRTQRPQKP